MVSGLPEGFRELLDAFRLDNCVLSSAPQRQLPVLNEEGVVSGNERLPTVVERRNDLYSLE